MPTTSLTTYSTAGSYTYTIPSWAYKIDVILLGGGAGGRSGGAGFNNGEGGGAGSWVATTLTRGVNIPFSTTTITGSVATAGAGGTNLGAAPTSGGSSTATATGMASLTAIGGVIDASTTQSGIAPGNTTYNSQTYTGGTAGVRGAGNATAPGAGGAGGDGVFVGYSTGGAGSAGRVWFYAYAQYADASLAVTNTPTATIGSWFGGDTSLAVTNAATSNTTLSTFLSANSPIVSAGFPSAIKLSAALSASSTVTATSTSAGLRTANVASSSTITATRTTSLAAAYQNSASNTTTATSTAAQRLSGVIATSLTSTATATTTALRTANVTVSQSITNTQTSAVTMSALLGVSRVITATSTAVSNYSTTINATKFPGFPYTLPYRFGFAVYATISAAIRKLAIADASLSATATISSLASSQFSLGASLPTTTILTATSLRDAKVNASQAIIAIGSVTGLRNTFAEVDNSSQSLTALATAAGLRVTRSEAFYAISATATAYATVSSGVAANTVTVTAARSTSLTTTKTISAIQVANATLATNISQSAYISASLTVPTLFYSTANRNALVDAELTETANSIQPSLVRTVGVSTSQAVTLIGMSPAIIPGLPYILPFVFDAPRAPVMSLATTTFANSVPITANPSSDSMRKATISASQNITATTTVSFTAEALLASSETLIVSGITTASSSVLYSAASQTDIRAHMYGFPYRLPFKLGPINVAQKTVIQSTIDVIATTNLTAGDKLSALIVADRSLTALANTDAKYSGLLSATSLVTWTPTSSATKTMHVAATLTVAASSSGSLHVNRGATSFLTVSAASTSLATYSTIISAPQSVNASVVAFNKYNVKVVAPLVVSLVRDTIFNQLGHVSTSTVSVANSESTMNESGLLNAPLTVSATPNAFMGSVLPGLSQTTGVFTFSSAIHRDATIAANLSVVVGLPARMTMRTRIAAESTLVAALTGLGNVSYKSPSLPVAIAAAPEGNINWTSAIESNTNISAISNTDDSQSQNMMAGDTNVFANILTVPLRTQYSPSENTQISSEITSFAVILWDGRVYQEVIADRPADSHRDVFCEAALDVVATANTNPIWNTYADSPDLEITVSIQSPQNFKTRYIASVGTPVIIETEAKAEMYHPAGSFVPFFYVGSNFF